MGILDAPSIPAAQKGAALGVAQLDSGSLVPLAQIAAVLKSRTTAKPVGQGELMFNVMDYSVAGDGATDDRAAINNAALALSTAGGGTLFFPAGVYNATGYLRLYSNVNYVGVPGRSIIKKPNGLTGSNSLLMANPGTAVTNVLIDGLTFQAGTTSQELVSIRLDAASRVVIRRCTFSGAKHAIYLRDNGAGTYCDDILIDGNDFGTVVSTAVNASFSTDGVTFARRVVSFNNTVRNVLYNATAPITAWWLKGDNHVVFGNRVLGSYDTGVMVTGAKNAFIANNFLRTNQVSIYNGEGSERTKIIGNDISSVRDFGISCHDNTGFVNAYHVITNNTIQNCGKAGLDIEAVQYVTGTGNHIMNCGLFNSAPIDQQALVCTQNLAVPANNPGNNPLASAVAAGATTITLTNALNSKWVAGATLMFTDTFETKTIQSVSGLTVTLTAGVSNAYPAGEVVVRSTSAAVSSIILTANNLVVDRVLANTLNGAVAAGSTALVLTTVPDSYWAVGSVIMFNSTGELATIATMTLDPESGKPTGAITVTAPLANAYANAAVLNLATTWSQSTPKAYITAAAAGATTLTRSATTSAWNTNWAAGMTLTFLGSQETAVIQSITATTITLTGPTVNGYSAEQQITVNGTWAYPGTYAALGPPPYCARFPTAITKLEFFGNTISGTYSIAVVSYPSSASSFYVETLTAITSDKRNQIALGVYTTAARPAATGYNPGQSIFDSTLNQVITSNGTTWRKYDGTAA